MRNDMSDSMTESWSFACINPEKEQHIRVRHNIPPSFTSALLFPASKAFPPMTYYCNIPIRKRGMRTSPSKA